MGKTPTANNAVASASSPSPAGSTYRRVTTVSVKIEGGYAHFTDFGQTFKVEEKKFLAEYERTPF
jgi:hypothetical protein